MRESRGYGDQACGTTAVMGRTVNCRSSRTSRRRRFAAGRVFGAGQQSGC